MMSMCPLVTGSKDPGQTARRTGISWVTVRRWSGRRDRTKAGLAVALVAGLAEARRARRAPGCAPSARPRPARPGPASRAPTSEARFAAIDVVAEGVGRVEEHHVVRRGGRSQQRPVATGAASDVGAGEAEGAGVLGDQRGGAPVLLDQRDDAGAAGPGLEADRARAGVQVEEPQSRGASRTRTRWRRRAPRGRGRCVGRVFGPAGRGSVGPPAAPPMIRVMVAFSMKSDCRDCSIRSTAAASSGRTGSVGSESSSPSAAARGGQDRVLVAQHPQARAGRTRNPDCEAPSTSPSRRCSRSTRLSSKPSVVAATASSRSRAGEPPRRWSPAGTGRAGRPGRPARAAGGAGRRRTGRRRAAPSRWRWRRRRRPRSRSWRRARRSRRRRRRASRGPSRRAGSRPCSISTRSPASGPSRSSLDDLVDGAERRRPAGRRRRSRLVVHVD